MKDKKKYIGVVLIIVLLVGGFFAYRKFIVQPKEDLQKKLEEEQAAREKAEQELEELKKEKGVEDTETDEETRSALGYIFLILIILGLVIYIVLQRQQGPGSLFVRHEIIEKMRKYAMEKDGYRLKELKCIHYNQGYSRGTKEGPVSLVVFSLMEGWLGEIEPPAEFNIGYYVNRSNLEDVHRDFKGKSIDYMYKTIKDTEWGYRPPHTTWSKTKDPRERAIANYLEKSLNLGPEALRDLEKEQIKERLS